MSRRDHANTPKLRYWHGGFSGRKAGDLLLPLMEQTGRLADALRYAREQGLRETTDEAFLSGTIASPNHVFITTSRDFATAWAVLRGGDDPAAAELMRHLFGVTGELYEVEPLTADNEPHPLPLPSDPDYPNGGSFQVSRARVVRALPARMPQDRAMEIKYGDPAAR